MAALQSPGQTLEQQIRSLRAVDVTQRENAVLNELEWRAAQVLAAIHHPASGTEADKMRLSLRSELEKSLGLRKLPWPPDLRARTVGVIERPGYRIEKIVYQTLPGVQVPAHLYIPAGLKGPAPAVLFYVGHWWPDAKTKPDFQAFNINMARLDFVVLTFDPFGQGERGVSRRDHRRVESLLVGISQQGLAEYETQCALQYLLTRKEVDPKRIGMTGASGGGYNTWVTSALDDRIAVVVPVVGTSEFLEQISVTRPLDWYHASEHCHFVANLIRFANNHELLAMTAPRPLMIIAASQDQSFPIKGVREVFAYGQQLYKSYGVPEKTAFFEDTSAGHGYQQKKREAAYGWFLKWLMNRGDGNPFPEPPTETEAWDSPELRCFPIGENQAAGPGFIAAVTKLTRGLPPHKRLAPLEQVLGSLPAPAQPQPHFTKTRLERLEIPSTSEISVPAFLLRPKSGERGVLVAVDDRGKEALAADPVVQNAFRKGWAVCGADPRGIGENATSKGGWVAAVSLLLGENFVWKQAFDLDNVLSYLAAAPDYAGKPIVLYAKGHNAALAAMYVLARRKDSSLPSRYVLCDGFISYKQFLDRPASMPASFKLLKDDKGQLGAYDREIPFQYFVFDVLHHFDLSQLLAESKATGMVVNPIDGDWNQMGHSSARKLLPAKIHLICSQAPEQAITAFIDR